MKNITKKMIITLCAFNLIACVPSQNEIKGAAPKSAYVPSYPSNYEAEIKIYLKKYLKDYESMKGFEIISEPKVGIVNYGAFAKGPEGKSFGEGGFSRMHLFKVKVVYTLSRLSEDTSLKITFRYTSLIIIINLNKKYYAQSNNHSYLL